MRNPIAITRFFRLPAVCTLLTGLLLAATPSRAITYTWSSTPVSTSWSTHGNWTPAGVPTSTDDVVINGCTTCPQLPANTTINHFTLSAGTLYLAGFTLSVTGNAAFTRGVVDQGTPTNSSITTGSISAAGPATVFGNSTGGVTIRAAVTVNSASVTLHYSVFHGPLAITRTGSVQDQSTGGNHFFGATSITNAGTKSMLLSRSAADIYYSTAALAVTGSSDCNISLAFTAGNRFKADLTVTANVTNPVSFLGIRFEGGANAVLFEAGARIITGPAGFNTGTLQLQGITQEGSRPQVFTTSGLLTHLQLGPNSVFTGPVQAQVSNVFLNGAEFAEPVTIEKSGGTNNNARGGNIFHKAFHLKTNSTRFIALGESVGDVFKGEVKLENAGSGDGYIYLASGFKVLPPQKITTVFKSNILLSNAGPTSHTSIIFGNSDGTSISSLEGGQTISVLINQFGASLYTNGSLQLFDFMQHGTTPQTLDLAGTTTLKLERGTVFNGPVRFSAPRVWVDRTTFNGSATLVKTGNQSDNWAGNNIFRGKVSIRNQAPAGNAINFATAVGTGTKDEILPPPTN